MPTPPSGFVGLSLDESVLSRLRSVMSIQYKVNYNTQHSNRLTVRNTSM